MAQHPLTLALVQTLQAQGIDLAPHLKTAFEKLSGEHPSGIPLAQMETPMMRQFREAKDAVPDGLLFFRMGDFYELFGADAVIAAEVCQLTLTSRDRNSDNPVPMAGVPVVNHRATLKKALAAGFKVAVCDQMEDPKLAKGLVRRDIVRIATPAVPGDLGEDDESSAPVGTWLSCAVPGQSGLWAFAFVDVSTGVFRFTGRLSLAELQQEILTLNPREVLVPGADVSRFSEFVRASFTLIPRVSPMPAWILRSTSDALRLFEDFFPLTKLNAFGLPAIDGAMQAVCGVLNYLKDTQRGVVKNLTHIDHYDVAQHLVLDESTRRHLDFFITTTGERKGSLFHFINQCATAAGARLLARKLNYPEKRKETVEQSHLAVETAATNPTFESNLLSELRTWADIERLLSRAAQNSIDPKGLAWLGHTLARVPTLIQLIDSLPSASSGWHSMRSACAALEQELKSTSEHLNRALENEPAQIVGKGGRIFKSGYNTELDELCDLEANFESRIAALETHERSASGIPTLKIGYTRAFGYYFEISKGKLNNVPAHFERKQTLVNGERFITPELKELEDKALSAAERRITIEKQLLEILRCEVVEQAAPLTALAQVVAQVDVWRCFAQLAKEHRWCKPQLVEGHVTALEECVHPVLAGLRVTQSKFVANNILLGDTSFIPEGRFGSNSASAQVLLVTGPNMAGKSTVMRQVALVHVLAQMGSWVPARSATLGVCDKIFTRIGSGDFALRNQSTFMVEMLETAQMLRFSTPASLLLLDEIGRGTSTYDGLSLAWAILEDLADRVKARALFSTHYHELVDAVENRPQILPMRMEVVEQPSAKDQRIIFTYRFAAGAAGKSYGIQVAHLAGVPDAVIARATEILQTLSAHDRPASHQRAEGQPVLTAAAEPQVVDVVPSEPPAASSSPTRAAERAGAHAAAIDSTDPLRHFLQTIDPSELTPRDALDLIYDLVQASQSTATSPESAPVLPQARKNPRKKSWDPSVLPSLF